MPRSIQFKLAIFIIFSVMTALVSLSLFYHFFKKTEYDVHFVNVAGSQRMLAERFLLFIKLAKTTGTLSDTPSFQNWIEIFDKKLRVLEHGGLAMGHQLKPAPPELHDELKIASELWQDVRPKLYQIAHIDSISQEDIAVHFLETKLPLLRNAMHSIVDGYEQYNQTLRQNTFQSILILALSGGVALFFSLWTFIAYIRERQKVENELREANRQIQKANQLKSEFISNISHEIRTPMNGIIGMTEFVLESELNPEQREYLEIVKKSADSLLSLLNDLLDFSKIEAGKLTLETISFRLHDLIDDTLKMMAYKAHGKGLELLHYIHPDVPQTVSGDPTRLRQVLVNLVGNAIKFTNKGEVYVEVQTLPKAEQSAPGCDLSSDDEICVRFQVRDTGIGIPKDKQALIFDKFSQADGSITRRFGGTGLGLTISRALVELMGGQIQVESEPNKGSTFFFTVRFQTDDSPSSNAHYEFKPDLSELRVLVIDHNKTRRNIILQQLYQWKIQTTPAVSIEDALCIIRRAEKVGYRFNFFITDETLPLLDGRSAAWHIHQLSQYKDAPIFLFVAFGHHQSRSQACNSDLVFPIKKPHHPRELLTAIIDHLDEKLKVKVVAPFDACDASDASSGSKSKPNLPPLRILLAEDNAVNQLYARKLLEKAGHTVEIARNGREVLERLQKATDFDLILMDVQMPEMDGFQACRHIRHSDHLPHNLRTIPIIALTAHAEAAYRERCLAEGMNGFVTKPIQSIELFQEIQKVMQERSTHESSVFSNSHTFAEKVPFETYQ